MSEFNLSRIVCRTGRLPALLLVADSLVNVALSNGVTGLVSEGLNETRERKKVTWSVTDSSLAVE